MNNLLDSDIFSLTLALGTYLAVLALYKKTKILLLNPLLVSIFAIITLLK